MDKRQERPFLYESPVPEFNSFYKPSSIPRSSRSMPLFEVGGRGVIPNSETFRKSVKFKSCKFWSSLPKDMSLFSDTVYGTRWFC